MRELDRNQHRDTSTAPALERPDSGEEILRSIALVGSGRCGTLLAKGFSAAGLKVSGPSRRGEPVPGGCDAVLICTPDSEIEAAAAASGHAVPTGHSCGAHGPELLSGHESAFTFHPLMTITADSDPADLRGAWCAIDGTDGRSLAIARGLAEAVGMTPVEIAPEQRAAYHAAGSIASNFLVTLEAFAEAVAASAGLPREALRPLAEATLRNWDELGAERALTGPVARGDSATVERQRAAVAEATPDLLDLFDALCDATRRLAAGKVAA